MYRKKYFRTDIFHNGEWNPVNRMNNQGLFSREKFWFAYGRQALKYGLIALGISKSDSVLVPGFICNVIESSFHDYQIPVIYYKIKKDFSPDLIDIENKMSKNSKALLCVNYFGYPQDYKKIKVFCNENNLFLIEDNAHGFMSKIGNIRLGNFGDISFTCVRKSIPVLHGAYLQINNNFNLNKISKVSAFSIDNVRQLKYYGGLLISQLLLTNKIDKDGIRNRKSGKVNKKNNLPDKLMDKNFNLLSLLIISSIDQKKFIKRKIKKYWDIIAFIKTELKNEGRLLYNELPNGCVPMSIPFLLQSQRPCNK